MTSVRALLTPLLALSLTGCLQDWDISPKPFKDFEGVEPSIDHGSWLSMDVAPDGKRLVMAYYDRERGGLGFAVGAPDATGAIDWVHERVDGYDDESGLDVGDRGQYASMRVAADGTVWIAYHGADNGRLYYAHRKGGPDSWVTGLVDAGTGLRPSVGQWASLDLDAQGSPVIAYYDAGEKALKTARPTSLEPDTEGLLTWTTETVRTTSDYSGVDAEGAPVFREADVGRYARLMIDGVTEYIACYDAAQQRLSLLEGTPGAYNHLYVTPEGQNMGQWPSMLIDGGTLRIALHDVGNQDLVIASRTTAGFELEVADGGEFVGADTELLKRAGNLAVLYFDGQNNDMKLAEKNGNVWVTETLGDPDKAVGFHNEIVRAGETWWAGSYDVTNRELFLKPLDDASAPGN